MIRDDIIMLAKEAGWQNTAILQADLRGLTRFAALVAADEREACAQVVEELGRGHGSAFAEFDCAAAIRARGEKK